MGTKTFIQNLSINNYVRKASSKSHYWVDFTQGKLDEYLKKGTAFNIIIHSNIIDDYYVIPYEVLSEVFVEKYYSKDKVNRKRWIGNIKNHKLKISNNPFIIDITEFYNSKIAYEESLFDVCKNDIDSFELENNSALEGSKKSRLVSYYERDPKLREKAIEVHGKICMICKFDFKKAYGDHGEDYIEVHHLTPLHTLIDTALVSPELDMAVLCANCHRMVHRKKDNPLSMESLSKLWQDNNMKPLR